VTLFPSYICPAYKDLFETESIQVPTKRKRVSEVENGLGAYGLEDEVARYMDHDDFPIYQDTSPVVPFNTAPRTRTY
jgi:hypothetical protein